MKAEAEIFSKSIHGDESHFVASQRWLPKSTLAQKNDAGNNEGYKVAKDHVNLLFCVNKTGTHKMDPLCIGKYEKPQCFSHVNMKSLSMAIVIKKISAVIHFFFKCNYSMSHYTV